MQVIKFQDEIINGADESTLKWTEVTGKEELMVEVFTSEQLFEDLSMYWKRLQERTDSAIYMSYEWVYHWWKHFGKNKQRSLFIVTVWDGTKLIAVAPFYKGYSAFGSLKLETRLQIIGSGGSRNEQLGYLRENGISDCVDFLVDPSYSDPVANLLAEDILTHSFLGVDVIKFNQAGDDSFIMSYLLPRLQNRFPNMTIQQSDTCRYINLEEKSLKKDIDNIQSGTPDQEYVIENVADSMRDIEKAAEDLISLHQNRWNRLGFPGSFRDDRFLGFFKDMLKYAFENNWLWFKHIKDSDGVCASRMVLKYNGRYYDFISGFNVDSSSSKYSPHINLLSDLMRDGIDGDVQRIELRDNEEPIYLASSGFKKWRINISLRKKKLNIPWLLNRIAAIWYKYAVREKRIIKAQRQKGILKMLQGYISLRWKSIRG